jgi:hypothetical protein
MATDTARSHLTTLEPADLPALISGRRTAMVVLSGERGTPVETAAEGDTVYLRSPDGRMLAGARVARAESFTELTTHELRMLRETYGSRTVGDGSAWSSSPGARFATVVWLTDVAPILDASAVPAELLGPSRHTWRSFRPAGAISTSRAA